MAERINNKEIKEKERVLNKAENKSAQEITDLYLNHRDEFIAFGRKYRVTQDTLIDVYQDAILIFFEQKEAGKLVALSCTDKTYLFSIGKHKIIDYLRKNNRKAAFDQDLVQEPTINPEILSKLILNDRQKLLKKSLLSLGKTCRKIIELFYNNYCSIKEITIILDYKSENVTKAQKSRCMKTLKKKVLNSYSK